jgi:hypothetical protein
MENTVVSWLGHVGWVSFLWAFAGLLVVNGAAVVAWFWRKDRELVQRYVAPWLAANVFLILVGVGVPAITSAGRLVVMATSNSAPVSAFRSISSTVSSRPVD